VIKEKYSNIFRGIALSCREDYKKANTFWAKYGFKPLDRVRSKSKEERYLKKWWYDFGNHDLFTMANSNSHKAKVLLDASIIIKLRDDDINDSTGTKFLLADWIVDEVDYYYASEIYIEIDRDKNKERAKSTRKYLTNYKEVLSTHSDVQVTYEELSTIVKGSNINDLSDKKQLAECIVGGLDYFITTDENILNHEEIVYQKYSVTILNPTEFILMIDKMANHLNYNSTRLAGANYQYRNPNSADINYIITQFIDKKRGEKKSELREIITKYTGDTTGVKIKIVQNKDVLLGIWLAKLTKDKVEIKLLRTNGDKLSNPLFDQLVNNIINFTINQKKRFLVIEEKYIAEENELLLEHFGFSKTNLGWHKLILDVIIDSDKVFQLAQDKTEQFYLNNIQDKLLNIKKQQFKHIVERHLWPLKFKDLHIPAYIIPIKPYWASQLFDHYAADSSLFGSQPQLVWNRENIYYRNVNPVSEQAPARILWYVSSSKYYGNRSKSIVATSYLDEVIIDKAKQLFKRYKSFGIYKWKDIYTLAKEDIFKEIKALKFSDTEVFRTPISLKKIDEILVLNERKCNTFASPVEINNKIFIDIYKEGKYG